MSFHIVRTHKAGRQHPLVLRLSSGFRRFQHRWYHPEEPLFQVLRNGQKPLALVIACCDSRVDPVLLTDCRPGDLFVVRNVANLVPPYAPDGGRHGVSAALEYAVKHLQVQDIIIMGHACCGGIQALVSGTGEHGGDEFIGPWVDVARRALEKADETEPGACAADRARACELWSVRLSLRNLLSFPWVKDAVEEGKLFLHGWYFDLQSGELLEYDEGKKAFHPLVGRPHLHAGQGSVPAGRHA